jgi:IPT/TIG domain
MRRRTKISPILPLLAVAVLALAACGKSDTKLKITGIEPNKGDVSGGTYVKIYGNRFVADGARIAKVYFGNQEGTVDRFVSDGEMIVQAPGGKAGDTVDLLVVFEPGGELKIPKAFTFVEKDDRAPNANDVDFKSIK